MRHKHLITLMPFQTRLPEQMLTTKQRLYAPYPGRPRPQVANHSLLLRDDNPNRYGKLDRSDKTQSNFRSVDFGTARQNTFHLRLHASAVRRATVDSRTISSRCCVPLLVGTFSAKGSNCGRFLPTVCSMSLLFRWSLSSQAAASTVEDWPLKTASKLAI